MWEHSGWIKVHAASPQIDFYDEWKSGLKLVFHLNRTAGSPLFTVFFCNSLVLLDCSYDNSVILFWTTRLKSESATEQSKIVRSYSKEV